MAASGLAILLLGRLQLAGQRLSPPREYLAQFAMVKATRKLEAPYQKEPIMETSTAITARQPWNKGSS